MNFRVLKEVRRRFAGWLTLRVVLSVLGMTGALALAALLADAALDLSNPTRAAAPWLLGIGVGLALGMGLRDWQRLTESSIARRFEQADASLGNRLINAVQLARRKSAGAAEELFRLQSVELGQEAAAQLKVWPVMRGSVRRAGAWLAGVLLAWLVLLRGAMIWFPPCGRAFGIRRAIIHPTAG